MKKMFKVLFVFLLTMVLLRVFVFSIWNIPGKVMYPLIHSNQKVLVLNKYWFMPKRGDVVIIRSQTKDRSYVRRIIAVGGDTIGIHDNKVFINGTLLNEPYKFIDPNGRKYDFPEPVSLIIPGREFFVMGDNRCIPSDFDSRVDGTINKDQIQGKVIFIF